MILAAGLGTRLRPLTNDRPKALVKVAGRTLLEITLERLRDAGVDAVIVNAHHFSDMVVEFLHGMKNSGMRIEVSVEADLLDTGGGLKKASWFFLEDGQSDEPFFLHNVDVLSRIDLRAIMDEHRRTGALATLAIQKRKTSRYLLFDAEGGLCGRRFEDQGSPEWVRGAVPDAQALAFSGIHVISPRMLPLMHETGALDTALLQSPHEQLRNRTALLRCLEQSRFCRHCGDVRRRRDL